MLTLIVIFVKCTHAIDEKSNNKLTNRETVSLTVDFQVYHVQRRIDKVIAANTLEFSVNFIGPFIV